MDFIMRFTSLKNMRMKKVLLAISAIIFLFACAEEDLDFYNPDVKLFVKQLKTGKYNSTNEEGVVDVPLFTQRHIPELLKYCEDMTEIPSFPSTSINSHFGGKPRLGECVLWIVEGIRLGYPPSYGCKLLFKSADSYDGMYFLANEQVLEAAGLYLNWWEKVKNPNPVWSPELLMYDPLLESDYRWW